MLEYSAFYSCFLLDVKGVVCTFRNNMWVKLQTTAFSIENLPKTVASEVNPINTLIQKMAEES